MTYTPKVILITGATSGFGAAMARLFAAEIPNVKLILTGRREDRLNALKDELSCDVHLWVQDVTDKDAIHGDFSGLPDAFQNIDCLVNNAGLALGVGPFYEYEDQDFETMIDVNTKGLSYMTRTILPGMVDRQRGHVVNIGSVAGNYVYPGGNIYAATKAFVNHFSLALRGDLKGKNVRVTSVEPGAVETEFAVVRHQGDMDKASALYKTHRSLNADHIARTILWIITQPPEMNVNRIEIMPTDQSFAGFDYTAA